MLSGSKVDFRLIASVLLLAAAATFTLRTIDGLEARRKMRIELAEIGHVRYDLLNADRWVQRLVPILEAQIDTLDLRVSDRASLRPTVERALYRLLDDVKEKVGGNPMIGNLMMGALRPHVPEYAGVVLAELGRPENKAALKKYIKSTLAESAKGTFGNVDMKWRSYILQRYGCADTAACRQEIGGRIARADAELQTDYLTVLGASALAFLLLLTGGMLGRLRTVVLLLFCLVLLAGGVLTPMVEVEAKISRLNMTLMGTPIAFSDQVLYFQSKSVLEVFRTLVNMGKPDMWVVGVLVLTFSVIFPVLKTLTVALCLFRPGLLKSNRLVKFLALESSRWSMADVMAVAVFMSFVAFNGLIGNSMNGLREIGAQIVIPTESSKILPGYHLFIGFCLASLFLSKKLERGIRDRFMSSAITHPSGIPEKIVRKVVARRGRLHAFETIVPAKTALVVIDLDEATVGRDDPTTTRRVVGNVNAVARALRSGGGVVAWVLSNQGVMSPNFAAILGGELAAGYFNEAQSGGPGSRIWPGLETHDGDLFATKARASAFFPGRCDLHEQLQPLGIDTLLIAGAVTNVCCESSARDATELDYKVIMVSDALSGHAHGLHEATLATFYRIFGDVRPSGEVMGLIAMPAATRAISDSIARS